LRPQAAATSIAAGGAARARLLNGYQWARKSLPARSGHHQWAIAFAHETLSHCRSNGYATFITKTEELLADVR
jgi:hypothetical protein